MNPQPRVSVITPFHNTPPEFLEEAIQSVLAQTYHDWELLLVDDGSVERISEVARHYASANHPRVRYMDHPGHGNRGHSASRNLGIAHARGDYVALLDSDDVWLPRKLEEQVPLMDARPEAGMLYGNTLYWHSWNHSAPNRQRNHVPDLGFVALTTIPPPRLLPLYLEGRAAVPCTCSILARRAVVQEVSGFVESARGLYEDQLFYAKMCLRAPVVVVPECWDLYRQHDESLCNRASREELRSSRTEFLSWLESYLTERGVESPAVWRALHGEQWKSRHPALARVRRTTRRLTRHTGRAASVSEDPSWP